MIATAEEFVQLRNANDPRADQDEAPEAVWMNVLRAYPDMKEWVVRNKSVPMSVLRLLAKDPDFRVRHAVASKRKCDADLLAFLAQDKCQGVRFRVACNAKTPEHILKILASDKHKDVADAAKGRLTPTH